MGDGSNQGTAVVMPFSMGRMAFVTNAITRNSSLQLLFHHTCRHIISTYHASLVAAHSILEDRVPCPQNTPIWFLINNRISCWAHEVLSLSMSWQLTLQLVPAAYQLLLKLNVHRQCHVQISSWIAIFKILGCLAQNTNFTQSNE